VTSGTLHARFPTVSEAGMQKRLVGLLGFVLFGTCLAFSQAADQNPVFFFGGKQLYVGMSKREAVATLSGCCKLSPPAESDVEKRAVREDVILGHIILPNEESPQRILGNIFFSGGKVLRITRPLAEDVDTYSEDLVGFVRAIKRSLPEGETRVVVSVRHERISNAESDVVSLSFPNGRGIELHIGTLDKPITEINKRDFVTLDETLQPKK
jgi:hypothetical protein